VPESMAKAERALAAFHTAVSKAYGPEEALKAAEEWIEALEKTDRAGNGLLPDLRRTTISAAAGLASRIVKL